MKVVFIFMSSKSAEPGTADDSYKRQTCSPYYEETFGDEVYFKMLESLVEDGTITDLKVFFESNKGYGKANFVKGAENFVIPEVRLMEEYIDDDTVIFARGGFKHWHDWLLKYKKRGNWLMIYAANTGRDRWTFWDVVFDDLRMQNTIDRHGRYYFPFIKPTNEDVFHPVSGQSDPKYDICLGASHITDKKGQYNGLKLMRAFHSIYGYYPNAIMPGSPRRSTETNKMICDPLFYDEIESPGFLTKPELAKIYNDTKVFLHLGCAGQNDRSIIEAYACGTPVGIRGLKYHTPLLKPNQDTIVHFDLDNDPDFIKSANKLHYMLGHWTPDIKERVFQDYQQKMGYEHTAIPVLKNLFRTIKFEGEPSIRAKEHLVHAMRGVNGGDIE